MQIVADPACSADGRWVAYTVDSVDTQADEHRSRVWMVSTDGTQPLQLTASERSAEKPRFSPDGLYLSFSTAPPSSFGMPLTTSVHALLLSCVRSM